MPGAPNPKAHLPLYIELIEIGTEGSGPSLQALPKGVAYIPRKKMSSQAKITRQLRNTNISIGNRVVFLGLEAKAGQETEIPALWEGEEKGLVPLLSTYLVAGAG